MFFKRIVVGVDDHEGGRDAIALARRLADDEASVTLVHVYAVGVEAGDTAGARANHALELLERARAQTGIDAQLRVIAAEPPGRGLHEVAHELGADLLVVGSTRHGVLGRVLVGDDTHASLNGAPSAVAVAPSGYADHAPPIREVGVAYNETPESEHALAVGRTLAGELGAALSACEVVSLPSYIVPGLLVALGETIEGLVEQANEKLSSLEGVDAHAVYGVPAEELARYSASVDLLIVGSRDYGPLGRLVHGSTSQRLARAAHCPLLVLTRAARAAGDPGREASELAAAA
jgi:nucleotide-binding universal stress UspA family protein